MQRYINLLIGGCLITTFLMLPANSTFAQADPEALKFCRDLAYSIEEDFVAQGPVPPDGNPIISDGDLLGPDCSICARNQDLLLIFEVDVDLGLDAVHIVDVDSYLVAFSTELDSPNAGDLYFTAGDFLATNGTVIPNRVLLHQFNLPRVDLGLDAIQLIGNSMQIKGFLNFAATQSRQDWLLDPDMLGKMLIEFGVDILISVEGTAPEPLNPLFLDGDLLSAATGSIVATNGDLLPNSVPAGIPSRGVDFGMDAANLPLKPYQFSTEILYRGRPAFTDGDLLLQDNGIVIKNVDLIDCFEPKAAFLGLDAFFMTLEPGANQDLLAHVNAFDPVTASTASPNSKLVQMHSPSLGPPAWSLEPCRELAFSTEEDFVTQGPEPPDGNPIISDGDLLGNGCAVCARNAHLLQRFDVTTDLGLDAVDVIDVESGLVAFSTELDSPHVGQFTAGDLLATNGTNIPNRSLLYEFPIAYDVGLDAVLFVGDPERILAFFEEARQIPREAWLTDLALLVGMLRQWEIDIWFSTEGTGPIPTMPQFLDGDLLSAKDGTIVAGNDILLPPDIPAGIPHRGVDFGLDAVAGPRNAILEQVNFSTEILFEGNPGFADGDVLKVGNGVVYENLELIGCFEANADFLGLDALSRGCIPQLEWTWSSTTVAPDFDQVMMAPVVADLNADDVPDIIFSTFDAAAGWQAGGILRAISGDGSGELFSVTDPAYRVQSGAEPAVADIDNDGQPEIMVSKQTGEIICFEHDGSFKWATTGYYMPGRIGIAVPDLDHDGIPEIVSGNTVLNGDGTLRWSGTAGSNYVTVVADLDLDGSPEIVTGNTAYRSDGTVYWSGSPAGKPAIGNFDDDPYPEIVVVGNDQVSLKEHDGTIKWGPVSMPTGGGNGPPVVADMDGDGEPEIGVGGYDWYVAFETDGGIKWMADIRDYSSRAAGSSAFDFDGDGSFEIVYSDERYHRIFKGSNGGILFEVPGRSGTLMEQPIIADVDNDGQVEIVFAVNNYTDPASNTGIEVYGNDACWPNARKIWNQHTYHITNINADASVPLVETNNWEVFNNYRTQATVELCGCDLNHDGACNILDYQLFIQDWGSTTCGTPPGSGNPPNACECDLNYSGGCNILDYQIFIQDWGRTDCPVP